MKKITSLTVALVLVAGVFGAVTASAATVSELQAMIASLQSQLSALGGTTSTVASTATTFTSDLTIGSTGASVTALQQFLVNQGYLSMPAGASYGYFGSMTKAAVVKFQAANGISSTGYFGPLTRAAANALQTPVTVPTTTTTTTTTTTSADTLSGGAGSVSEYTLVSSYNNEKVGEDDDDVAVMGVKIKADDSSDLRVTAVKIALDGSSAASDQFEDYAKDLSIWYGDKEVARVDADQFNDDNDYTKTITLDSGVIIKAGETETLKVAVSGASTIDSENQGKANGTWNVTIPTIRFIDASGASTSDTPDSDISSDGRDFYFDSYASATGLTLKATAGDSDVNDAHTVTIDNTNETDGVSILSFKLKADGDSKVRITKLPVTLTSNEDLSNVVSALYLDVDGEEQDSIDVGSSATTTTTFVFDNCDFTIDANDTVTVTVKADIMEVNGTFGNGDTLAASFNGKSGIDSKGLVAKDGSGSKLDDTDVTGTVTSKDITFNTSGMTVALVSTDVSVNSGDAGTAGSKDLGTYTIKFKVTAGDDDVYVATTTTQTSTAANDTIAYYVTNTSASTETADFDTTADEDTQGYKVAAGDTETFTLTVYVTASSSASHKVSLEGIGWGTEDSRLSNAYSSNLDDYETSQQYLRAY